MIKKKIVIIQKISKTIVLNQSNEMNILYSKLKNIKNAKRNVEPSHR